MSIVVCANCGAKNRVDDSLPDVQAVCGKCHAKLDVRHCGPAVVTDQSFASEVLAVSGIPVMVDCWAAWCGPCRAIGPTIDRMASEAAGRWKIAKLNVDDNPGIAQRFQIDSIPTLLIFRDGQLVDRLMGAQPRQVLESRLAGHVAAAR